MLSHHHHLLISRYPALFAGDGGTESVLTPDRFNLSPGWFGLVDSLCSALASAGEGRPDQRLSITRIDRICDALACSVRGGNARQRELLHFAIHLSRTLCSHCGCARMLAANGAITACPQCGLWPIGIETLQHQVPLARKPLRCDDGRSEGELTREVTSVIRREIDYALEAAVLRHSDEYRKGVTLFGVLTYLRDMRSGRLSVWREFDGVLVQQEAPPRDGGFDMLLTGRSRDLFALCAAQVEHKVLREIGRILGRPLISFECRRSNLEFSSPEMTRLCRSVRADIQAGLRQAVRPLQWRRWQRVAEAHLGIRPDAKRWARVVSHRGRACPIAAYNLLVGRGEVQPCRGGDMLMTWLLCCQLRTSPHAALGVPVETLAVRFREQLRRLGVTRRGWKLLLESRADDWADEQDFGDIEFLAKSLTIGQVLSPPRLPCIGMRNCEALWQNGEDGSQLPARFWRGMDDAFRANAPGIESDENVRLVVGWALEMRSLLPKSMWDARWARWLEHARRWTKHFSALRRQWSMPVDHLRAGAVNIQGLCDENSMWRAGFLLKNCMGGLRWQQDVRHFIATDGSEHAAIALRQDVNGLWSLHELRGEGNQPASPVFVDAADELVLACNRSQGRCSEGLICLE